MRRFALMLLVACSSGSDLTAQSSETVDACVDATHGLGFELETATATPPVAKYPALVVASYQLVGVRFTTTATHTITELGALIFATNPTTQVFMAVVPLEADGFPASDKLSNAIGYAVGSVPYSPSSETQAPASTTFTTSFALPPGTYGLIMGSGRLGVPSSEADLPYDVDEVGDPDHFRFFADDPPGYWANAQVNAEPVRMFIRGN